MKPFLRLLTGIAALAALSLAPLPASPTPEAVPSVPRTERVVFLGGRLGEAEAIAFTSAVAATGHPGTVLFDTPTTRPYLKGYFAAVKPELVVPVGGFAESSRELSGRFGCAVAPAVVTQDGRPTGLWKALFPKADRVVVCPAEPRKQLLQAAWLAGLAKAPLFVLRGKSDEPAELRRWLAEWQAREVLAVGKADSACAKLPGVRTRLLPNASALETEAYRHLRRGGKVTTLVVANPHDGANKHANLSALAPWLAAQKRAVLLLTNAAGTNVERLVRVAVERPQFRRADHLLILGDLDSIPVERRENPLTGKDSHIEMEPLTPTEGLPFEFATGRLFAPDPALVPLILARQKLLAKHTGPYKALVASNPGGGLDLLETFSRNSARELRNCGYETTALFRHAVAPDDLRRLLPEQDVFLWEGHHSTLVRDWKFPEWDEPMRPSLVVLQSCLALAPEKVQPLFRRGAVAVVGSSTRTYSASGGAFALAYLDGVLYDRQTLGGSLRQAKNFLLAYARLKEKRLGPNARLTGANLRSSWAFSLWGDPTLKLPAPPTPESALPGVRAHVQRSKLDPREHALTLYLPESAYEPVKVGKYEAKLRPNARLAGLLLRDGEDSKHLVPFVFAEVSIPDAPDNQVPALRGKVPDRNRVFVWDGRRKVGYLLVTPREKDERELRFRVSWSEASVSRPVPAVGQ